LRAGTRHVAIRARGLQQHNSRKTLTKVPSITPCTASYTLLHAPVALLITCDCGLAGRAMRTSLSGHNV
jgi:hypothetical protein